MSTLLHKQQKVTEIYSNEIFSKIMKFLNRRAIDSENTKEAYETDLRQFFRITRDGKELEHLTVDDLQYTLSDIEEYQTYLNVNLNMMGKTVNRKISAIRKMMTRLSIDKIPVDLDAFQVEKLPEHDSETYDYISWSEASAMTNEAMKLHEQGYKNGFKHKWSTIAIMIETSVVTSFRLDSILKLTKDNFGFQDGVHIIKVVGKGKKIDKKAIKESLYNKIIQLQQEHGQDNLFPISDSTALRCIKELAEKIGVNDRNVTVHSLKKCGLSEVYEITGGDFMAVAKQGSHKSFATSQAHYVALSEDMSKAPNLLIGEQLDLSKLNNASKEEILEAIRKCGLGIQAKILKELK